MTRPFNQVTHCPNCKTWVSSETIFGRWIRNNHKLDSKDGYCVVDQDYWIHAYKTHGNRDFQCIMLVEIKTNGASLSPAQQDTLHIANQLMRNRNETPTKELKWQAGRSNADVFSPMRGRRIQLRAFGMHVLSFSALGPDDSDVIAWDTQIISIETLTSILRFDLDPDSLKPIDLRNHHRTHANYTLALPGVDVAP